MLCIVGGLTLVSGSLQASCSFLGADQSSDVSATAVLMPIFTSPATTTCVSQLSPTIPGMQALFSKIPAKEVTITDFQAVFVIFLLGDLCSAVSQFLDEKLSCCNHKTCQCASTSYNQPYQLLCGFHQGISHFKGVKHPDLRQIQPR